MTTLKTVNFNENKIVLSGNIVQSDILPTMAKELGRDISIDGETEIHGAVYARNLYLNKGPLTVDGAVFAQGEIHGSPEFRGRLLFRKAVGCSGTMACLFTTDRAAFHGDISAKKISMRNCFVSGSVMADDIDLDNCVVLGGAFATKRLSLRRTVAGTFNAPEVLLADRIFVLMPSAYSVEPISVAANAELWNLTTADLAALYFGTPESADSGKIRMDAKGDTIEVQLADPQGNRFTVRSLSVAGKVMMADMLDAENLRNHFILKTGALAGHLAKTFHLEEGDLVPEKVEELFFAILSGARDVKPLDKSVSFQDLRAHYA
jgi:hypothetical protein